MTTNGTPRGPLRTASDNMEGLAEHQRQGRSWSNGNFSYQASSPKQRQRARQQKTTNRSRTTNRTKNGGFNITINEAPKGGNGGGPSGGGATGEWSKQSPIGDAEFLSAAHIRAFSERGRRSMRQAAMDFSYAAQALKAVLREVPAADGGRSGAYMRANRVARGYKKAANAAQAASAHSARTWPAFMREYAPELNAYGSPRTQQRQRMNFGM